MSEMDEAHRSSEPAMPKLEDSLPVEIRGAKQQLSELLAKWQRQARGLLAVHHIARVALSSQGLEEILAAAVDQVEDSLGVARAWVILLDPDTGDITYYGPGGQVISPFPEESQAGESIVKQVIDSGQSVRAEIPRTRIKDGLPVPAQPCAALCVPLLVCDHVVGAIQVTNKLQHRIEGKAHLFNEHDQEVLEGVAAFVAMAVENNRLQEATRTQAAARTLQETVVTLAHYVNNPLQGMVGAAELLKEQLEQALAPPGVMPDNGTNALSLVDVILQNAQEISVVLRLLQDVALPQSTTYVGSQQMLDIGNELQARIDAVET